MSVRERWMSRAWTVAEIRDAQRWKQSGMHIKEIATALDRTEAAVAQKLCRTNARDHALLGDARPSWSYPDKELLKVCRQIRLEIQQALRVRSAGHV